MIQKRWARTDLSGGHFGDVRDAQAHVPGLEGNPEDHRRCHHKPEILKNIKYEESISDRHSWVGWGWDGESEVVRRPAATEQHLRIRRCKRDTAPLNQRGIEIECNRTQPQESEAK